MSDKPNLVNTCQGAKVGKMWAFQTFFAEKVCYLKNSFKKKRLIPTSFPFTGKRTSNHKNYLCYPSLRNVSLKHDKMLLSFRLWLSKRKRILLNVT